jgi:galactonate dehydratase
VRITAIETIPVDRYLFVQVHTDEGITGLGESGTWGFLEASQQAVETFKRHLIGEDPLRIEHHWQYLYRWSHFRGAAIMGALSAIDIALWDIMGKRLGVPCYQLLGGKCRDKVRVYSHVFGATAEELVQECLRAKQQGLTAVGHLNPLLDEDRGTPYFKTHARSIEDAIDTVRRCREAVGSDVDLCIEVHRRLTPAEAIVLARGIQDFHPLFYEDPVLPDNFDAMALVAQHVTVPIATGERLHTIFEFQMLLERGAVRFVRPDVCLAGGLTHCKKIAALAEAHYVGVIPHNPLGPVSTAACVQLAACIPNFTILEYPVTMRADGAPGGESGFVRERLELEDGFLQVPDKPGIGVELVEGAQEMWPYRPLAVTTRLHADGSVVDQ